MHRVLTAHSRVVLLLTCCSVGWLAYSRHNSTCWSLQQVFEAVIKHNRKQVVAPAQPDLEHLPMDVLLEIMALLELKEILRL
ncbi:hypothetical protein BJ165DRAFT_1446568 [Panaeolus papilionaceus]|nr:hypothetical protein BJ165DRAFT_1446568 [Panaeolus papilionaceus]